MVESSEGGEGFEGHEAVGSARRVVRVTVLLTVIHSALASSQMKAIVAAVVGRRYRNGLYRALYCLQAVVMFGTAAVWYLRLPNRTLIRVPGVWAWLMRLGQVFSLLLLWHSVQAIGVRRALGIAGLSALRSGSTPEPEPEAQGPALDQNGRLQVVGPYRYTRHGPNLTIFGVVWLQPTITVNWLTFAIIASLYALIGSLHEEFRLRRAYGVQYLGYQQQVPFMLPRIRLNAWIDNGTGKKELPTVSLRRWDHGIATNS